MISLGQVQHVVDQLGHPLQLFKVAVQGLAVLVNASGAGEGHLGMGQQIRQGGSQLMRNISGERRQSLKRIIQTLQHGVERPGQFGQFGGHGLLRQAGIE